MPSCRGKGIVACGERCEAHLLSDDPADVDDFGAHNRLVEALAETIRAESRGRAIALIGQYGSGKSTVIRILQERLSTSTETQYILFAFDAWAHQGDPLRRSFLEEMRESLLSHKWITPGALAARFEELTQRRETSRATPTSNVSWQGVITAATVPFAALLTTLAITTKYWELSAGALLPLLTATGLWLIGHQKGDPKCQELRHLADLFWNRSGETIESESWKLPDPTSVEFRSLFEGLIEQAFYDKPNDRNRKLLNRSLIIVLDNLDRLDPKNAMSLFATMRTFFDSSSPHARSERALRERLWFIVPFDTEWLSRLRMAPGTQIPDSGGEKFLEKSFEVRLYVSEPTLSTWRAHLFKLLASALPEHTADYGDIYLLYELAVRGGNASTAPRSFKQFVNRVVLSHRLWRSLPPEDAIPLRTQAAYILFGDPSNFVDGLLKKSLLGAAVVERLRDDFWVQRFAAQYYNVPPKNALDVLLREPIAKSLSEGSTDALADVKKLPGFNAVCESVVTDELPPKALDGKLVANASFVTSETGTSTFGQIPTVLRAAFKRVEHWDLNRSDQGAGIVRLLSDANNSTAAEDGLEFLTRTRPPSTVDVAEGAAAQARDAWLAATAPIILWVLERVGQEAVRNALHTGDTASSFVGLLEAVQKLGPGADALYSILEPRCSYDSVMELLAERIRSDEAAEAGVYLMGALKRTAGDWQFSNLVQVLEGDLSTADTYSGERAYREIEALIVLTFEYSESAAAAALRTLSTNGHLLHHLSTLCEKPELLGRCLLPYLLFGSETVCDNAAVALEVVRRFLQDPEAPANAGTLSSLMLTTFKYGQARTLFETLRDTERGKALAAVVLRKGKEDGRLGSGDLCSIALGSFAFLSQALPEEECQTLLSDVASNSEFETHLVSDGFDEGRLTLYEHRLGMVKPAPSTKFVRMLEGATKSLDVTAWTGEVGGSTKMLPLTAALVRSGRKEWLEEPLADALRTQADGMSKGASQPDGLSSVLPSLLVALDKSRRIVLLKDIMDMMNDGALTGIITCFGSELLSSGCLAEDADRFARHTLRRLLENPVQHQDLAWAAEVIRSQNYLGHVSDETKRDLSYRAAELSRRPDLSAEMADLLAGIQKVLPSANEGEDKSSSEPD
jgi:hypothetical protein